MSFKVYNNMVVYTPIHIFVPVPCQNLDFQCQCHGLFCVQLVKMRGDCFSYEMFYDRTRKW